MRSGTTTPLRLGALVAVAILAGCGPKQPVESVGRPAKNAGVPDRPEALVFPEQAFTPPLAADYRHELSNGVPVFVAPGHDLPLVKITFTFQGGAYLEPDDQTGVADLTLALMRDGGTTSRSPDELDESFAFLAADVATNASDTKSTASLDVLRDNLDEALPLFVEMVRQPGFDRERFELEAKNTLDRMKARNDDAGDIAIRETARLQYGEDHVTGVVMTQADLEAIGPDELRAFHGQVIHPGNLVVSVTGDIEASEVLPMLEAALDGWETKERVAAPSETVRPAAPGLYHIQKDIPQGKVRIGLPGIQRDDPDYFPLMVMNDILGGGGFTSRIMGRVRSDEGLAYGARSGLDLPAYWPGTFTAWFDSKNPTVALATQIVVEEMDRMRTEPVSASELSDAKASIVAMLPRSFASKDSMVATFVNDELTGRDPTYWQTWQENIEKVTAEDVQRIAGEYLTTDALVILVVGDWEPIAAGDPAGRATMAQFGEPIHLPLRDPLTQEPSPARSVRR